MIALPAVLTLADASACAQRLCQSVARAAGQQVTVDASALVRFDSAALAVLLELRRECARLGKVLDITGMVPSLQALAVLYGVEGLLVA